MVLPYAPSQTNKHERWHNTSPHFASNSDTNKHRNTPRHRNTSTVNPAPVNYLSFMDRFCWFIDILRGAVSPIALGPGKKGGPYSSDAAHLRGRAWPGTFTTMSSTPELSDDSVKALMQRVRVSLQDSYKPLFHALGKLPKLKKPSTALHSRRSALNQISQTAIDQSNAMASDPESSFDCTQGTMRMAANRPSLLKIAGATIVVAPTYIPFRTLAR